MYVCMCVCAVTVADDTVGGEAGSPRGRALRPSRKRSALFRRRSGVVLGPFWGRSDVVPPLFRCVPKRRGVYFCHVLRRCGTVARRTHKANIGGGARSLGHDTRPSWTTGEGAPLPPPLPSSCVLSFRRTARRPGRRLAEPHGPIAWGGLSVRRRIERIRKFGPIKRRCRVSEVAPAPSADGMDHVWVSTVRGGCGVRARRASATPAPAADANRGGGVITGMQSVGQYELSGVFPR